MDVYLIAALLGMLNSVLGIIDRMRNWWNGRAPRTHGHKGKGRR